MPKHPGKKTNSRKKHAAMIKERTRKFNKAISKESNPSRRQTLKIMAIEDRPAAGPVVIPDTPGQAAKKKAIKKQVRGQVRQSSADLTPVTIGGTLRSIGRAIMGKESIPVVHKPKKGTRRRKKK